MGSMRTPALQTLLLYSSSLDTNTDCSRIVCDSWLEIKFCDSQSGEESLSHAVQLRSTWQALIEAKLQGKGVRINYGRGGLKIWAKFTPYI